MMRAFEVSETGVWRLSFSARIFGQTLRQTPFRHLPKKDNKNNTKAVSDKVSDAVCLLSDVCCLSGGVSLGRATSDTPDTRAKKERM
jgi:hypothetical protein